MRKASSLVSAQNVGPLLAALMGLLVLIALGHEVAIWAIVLWLSATGLGLYGSWKQHPLWFSGRLRLVGGLLFLLLAFVLSGWGNWLAIASQSVLVLLAVKALEMRSQRDFYQVAALVLLGMGLAAWLRVDVLLGIYLLITLYLALLGLLWQPLADAASARGNVALQGRDFRYMLVFSLAFMVFLLPMTGLFFLLLPRTPTPLWAWAPPQGSARSGFSPDLAPDQISRLAEDPAVAFRAQITPRPENPEQLYWVGAILWHDQGTTWEPDPPAEKRSTSGVQSDHPDQLPAGPLTRQEIVLSPGDSHYLFALSFPRRWQIPLAHHELGDGVMQLQKSPSLPLRYVVWSGASPVPSLRSGVHQAALQVPATTPSAIVTLAKSLAGHTPNQTIEHLMHWFQGPSFHYSLKAPAAYPHGQTMADFLLHSHTGFCEYYAGGLALLLRLDGVPARVVTGYHGGEYNPVGHYWLVRQSMAHAWVQAWIAGKGWVRLDATPAAAATGLNNNGNSGAFAADEVPAAQRVWDWLQWEWINTVIDLTPAKQRSLWTSAGLQFLHFFQSSQTSSQKILHFPRHWSGFSAQQPAWRVIVGIFALLGLVLLSVWYRRRQATRNTNAHDYWRHRAIEALHGLGLKDARPGQESVFCGALPFDSTLRNQLLQDYSLQRYGPHPDAEGDAKLQAIVAQIRHNSSKGV